MDCEGHQKNWRLILILYLSALLSSSAISIFVSLLLSSPLVKLIVTIGIKNLRHNTMVENHKLKNVEKQCKKLEEKIQILQQEF